MAFSEFETRRCEKALKEYVDKHRPPAHLRSKVDLSYRVTGQSVEVFEVRPLWNNPTKIIEESVAKATYVKSQKLWKVYWQRADLKWHRYEPYPEATTLEEFLSVVEQDEYACFYG